MSKKQALLYRLATEDFVPLTYTKDGESKCYIVTLRYAPEYQAKTDRVKVATPDHLVQVYDYARGRWMSLKVDQITM